MGKKINKKEQVYKSPETFPIHKKKSFLQNLNLFLKLMKAKHSKITTIEYLRHIHRYVRRCTQQLKFDHQKTVISTLQKIKICSSCDNWANQTNIVQCLYCDDYYHQKCIKDLDHLQDWICSSCSDILSSKQKKKQHLKKYLRKSIQCSKCNVRISSSPKSEQLLYCLKCSKQYHKKCYFKSNSIICEFCNDEIEGNLRITLDRINMKQSNLLLYGFSCKSSQKKAKTQVQMKRKMKDQGDELTQTSTISSERLFKKNFPPMLPQQIAQYKKQLLKAILTKNMEYVETLQPINCSFDSDYEQSLDFSLTEMKHEDRLLYQNYKKQPIGPFRLIFRQNKGYDVQADKDLPKGMIVCEYVGDVVTLRQALKSNNDSLMQLKVGRNSNESLIIRPEKYTNIARFINGINNKLQKSGNVLTTRKMIKGTPAVILYTSRAIKKGQSLIYDYNAGGKNTYDTSYFV